MQGLWEKTLFLYSGHEAEEGALGLDSLAFSTGYIGFCLEGNILDID